MLQTREGRSYTETRECIPDVSRESWMSADVVEHKDCTCVYMLEVDRTELEAVLREALRGQCECRRAMWHTAHPRDPECFALVCACKHKAKLARFRARLARSTRPLSSCHSHIYYWQQGASRPQSSPGVSFVLEEASMQLLLDALQPAVGNRFEQLALLSVCLAHCSLRMCMRYSMGAGSIVVDARTHACSSELVQLS